MKRKHAWILLIVCLPISIILVYSSFLYLQCRWEVENYLKSHKWALPSTIFASPMVLEKGMPAKRSSLIQYLQRLNYQKSSGKNAEVKAGEYFVGPNTILFRKRQAFEKQQDHHPVRVEYDSDRIRRITELITSRSLQNYELEPVAIRNLYGTSTEKRRIVSYDDVPLHLIQAVLAIEDRRFFEHQGVDFTAILRAASKNLDEGKTLQGGSTITQQFIKNSLLTSEKSIHRKVSEAVMAMMLERRLTKKQILELYLNEIYLGQDGAIGIHGVGEASFFYFAKDVSYLTVPESALLAGMIQAPSSLNPYRHPEGAIRRRNVVLSAMANLDVITPGQCIEYWKTQLRLQNMKPNRQSAHYFTDLVRTQLEKKYNDQAISQSLSIFTTLDIQMQEAAEKALTKGLQRIDEQRFASTKKHVQGCLIAIEPATGFIRAFVGGRDSEPGLFNHINQAFRQPGSVFKPVVYAAALEKSYQAPQSTQNVSSYSRSFFFTPATTIQDEPFVLEYANQRWEPKNSDGLYHGMVTMRTALAQSYNVATARLGQTVGWHNIAQLAQKMGFSNLKPYPSVSLGVFEATPWQVASAYTVFANRGTKTEPRPIVKITDGNGKVLEKSQVSNTKVIHPETAFLITDMLRSVMQQGTAAAVRKSGFTRPAAGKTGTTDDFRDAWFAGYVPQLLCVVWVGYDDNTSVEMHGAEAALPIWIDFMKEATENLPAQEFSVPAGIIATNIDPYTGLRATQFCPTITTEIFARGTEPQAYCQEHQDRFLTYFSPHPTRRQYGERPTYSKQRPSGGIWKKFKRIFRLS